MRVSSQRFRKLSLIARFAVAVGSVHYGSSSAVEHPTGPHTAPSGELRNFATGIQEVFKMQTLSRRSSLPQHNLSPQPRRGPGVVRAAWICFLAGLLLITAPLWRAAFETKPLKILRVVPDHAAAGNWVEIDGENFTRASRFFFD